MNKNVHLYCQKVLGKQRGVFTSQLILKNEIIEICPMILIPPHQVDMIHQTILHDYYFLWEHDFIGIALGFGSLYNHAFDPNAEYIMDFKNNELMVKALENIYPHTEIKFNYNGDAKSKDPLWFKVIS